MISLEALSYAYPQHDADALSDLTLQVRQGQLILVSGPTGCGKSTLASVLCGAIPHLLGGHLRGDATVAGQSIAATSVRSLSRRVGILLQNVEWQSFCDVVEDEVAFGLENLAVAPSQMRARIEDALQRVGALALRNRSLPELSSGERQRAMLAALLAVGQDVLILDEPLAYLDRSAAAALVALLRRLADEGRTILVLEHRRDLLREAADRELRLRNGRHHESCALETRDALPVCPAGPRGPDQLTVRELTFGWPRAGHPLLDRACFVVRGGESVVLVGDNGSGKTTLLRLAMGLHRPPAGAIQTVGHDPARVSTRRIADHACLVLPNPDHQLHLATVGEEIRWGAASREVAAGLGERLGLSSLTGRHPQSLSFGQKRRVTLAAALARRPRLLLLDEPSVGQDDESLSFLLAELGQYVSGGGALLCASHDERVIRSLAHRELCIAGGRLEETNPQHARPDSRLTPVNR